MVEATYHFRVGNFECMAVSDGTFTYSNPAAVLFANAPKTSLENVLREYGIELEGWKEWVSDYTALFVDTGVHKVLIDTGAGHEGPDTGKLLNNLRAGGVEPDEIDTILITHAHSDHIGGITNDQGSPTFPNARYFISRKEWDFWVPEPDLSGIDWDQQIIQLLIDTAHKNLRPIADRVVLIEDGAEVVSGIRMVAMPGHTPGQIVPLITSNGKQLMCTSDVLIHPININHPDWVCVANIANGPAVNSACCFLEMAVREKALVHGFHFPWPGLGHILPKGDGWQWQPVLI